MKKYLFSILLTVSCVNATAITYSENTAVEFFDETEIIIENGVTISAANGSNIPMYGSVLLYNHGTINDTIDTNGWNLLVHNTVNNAEINTVGGNVVQIISNVDEAKKLNITADNFTVSIENVPNLNFSDIKDMSAESFTITDSTIIIDDFTQWQNWDKHMTASGVIHLKITDDNAINYDGEYINNVSGAEAVNVQIEGLDGSSRSDKELVGGQFKLTIVRNTDYNVSNNGENSVLEKIKESDPDDKLIKALNSAENTNQINRIKHKSYRFNHDILLRPLRVINNFASINNITSKTDTGIGAVPVYIVSDNMRNIGGRVYFGNHYNDLYFNIGLLLNRFEYRDSINDFSGFMYGTDFQVKQYFDKLWLNGIGGINFTKFNADYVSSNKIKHNPYGVSWYTGLDSGYDFNIGSDFILSPFFGIG